MNNETKPRMECMNTEFKRFKNIIKTIAEAFTNPSLTSFSKTVQKTR